jgi:type IV secretion system protein VirB1
MAAIVRVESGGNPLAMWNNTTGQRVLPTTLQQAQAYLAQAMAAGQKVDVGIAQVDTENFAAYGLNLDNAFDACTNLRVGASILSANYRHAVASFGPGQVALYHAFEGYNSGHLWGDSSYANRILAAAGLPVVVGQGGGLTYQHRAAMPLVFVKSWSTAKAAPKPVKAGFVYDITW